MTLIELCNMINDSLTEESIVELEKIKEVIDAQLEVLINTLRGRSGNSKSDDTLDPSVDLDSEVDVTAEVDETEEIAEVYEGLEMDLW